MAQSDALPPNVQQAIRTGILNRLPLTVLAYVNQQLREWTYLFPNERQSVVNLLLFAADLDVDQSRSVFRELIQIEHNMGVNQWNFSTAEQTIQNSSQLARSPYFQQWRQAVQNLFDAAAQHALKGSDSPQPVHRLVVIDIPHPLEMFRAEAWQRWQQIGTVLSLSTSTTATQDLLQALLRSNGIAEADASPGVLDRRSSNNEETFGERWFIDAAHPSPSAHSSDIRSNESTISLNYHRLEAFRQNFSHELNTMRKDLGDADAVYDRLRTVEVQPWCPPEVLVNPAIREFVRALYLSGNGAVIFGNSFVEWAASEALRRARPRLLIARFGVRSKPKPFTSVAVFENPDQVNPTPAIDDLAGSSVDAQILALYIWLAALRFEEYRRSTVCVCLAESIAQAYVVAPPEFAMPADSSATSLEQLRAALGGWMERS